MLHKSQIVMLDGIVVTEEYIRTLAAGGEKIRLIKLYRQVTGLGLKESKEAVEKNCCGVPTIVPPRTWPTYTIDVEKTVAFFDTVLPHHPIAPAKPSPRPLTRDEKLIRGIRCVLKNWSVLGYSSPNHLVHTVCDNFLSPNPL